MQSIYTWLAANPDIPYALLTLSALLLCYVWRSKWPASWERWAAWFPKSDTSTLWNLARKALQAWPSAALGALLPSLASGGDVGITLKGVTFGLLAPVLYEAAKLAKQLLGKPPGGPGGLPAIVCALCLACTPSHWAQQGEAAAVVSEIANNRILPTLEAAYRADGVLSVVRARDANEAQLYFIEWKARWVPVWAAWEVLREAHAAWEVAVNTNGDVVTTGEAVRNAFCTLKSNALRAGARLPDFPLLGCEKGLR